jgi:long-chain acyl-CoA synthetase
VADSGADLVVVESDAMRRLVPAGDSGARDVVVIDDGGIEDLIRRGEPIADTELDERIDAIDLDDLATVVYTSGTTGRSKGCVLTHRNLRSNTIQSLDAVRALLGEHERSLLFLPLAHSFAKIIALVGFEHGVKAVFASDLKNLPEEMVLAEPTMIVAVPRVFEKIFNAARQSSRQRHLGRLFDRAADVAVRVAHERSSTGSVSARVRIEHAIYDRLVYAKIRAAFGGSMRFAFSGGSALGERLALFFDGIGVRVFEGYGLTETSPVLTVNRADAWRPGTVGVPVAGTTLRIADDGEVLVIGPQVFSGYWQNDHATSDVFTRDGWFSTGDLGRIEDGFVSITGRKKDLIVTAGGKNVAPTPIEDQLRAHRLISQAVVIGDNRPFIAALITVDDEALAQWHREHERDDSDASRDDALRAEIQQGVDAVNRTLSRAESIRQFAILPTDFTIEHGELTPTMKLRRATIAQRYAAEIEELYSRSVNDEAARRAPDIEPDARTRR